uniref:Uncharacterized protein n=1 Tax=Arundo donax TaxID=35708 RepID=A0A0A9BD09_ARUDO
MAGCACCIEFLFPVWFEFTSLALSESAMPIVSLSCLVRI